MFTAGFLFFTNFDTGNPLLWRSFSNTNPNMLWLHSINPLGDFSNHHSLNLMAEAGLFYALAWYLGKGKWSKIYHMGILASYGAILTWAIHEGMWWIGYIFYYGYWIHLNDFSGFGEFLTLGLLIFTPILGLYAPKKFLLWMAAFYAVWFLAGFHITEGYTGNTSLYSDIGTNLWEDASWAWAAIGFYLLERKGLLAWFEKISALVNNRYI